MKRGRSKKLTFEEEERSKVEYWARTESCMRTCLICGKLSPYRVNIDLLLCKNCLKKKAKDIKTTSHKRYLVCDKEIEKHLQKKVSFYCATCNGKWIFKCLDNCRTMMEAYDELEKDKDESS